MPAGSYSGPGQRLPIGDRRNRSSGFPKARSPMSSSLRSTGGLSPAPGSWHYPAVDDLAAESSKGTYLGRAPRRLNRPPRPSPARGEGERSRGESLTREKVTDGPAVAVTLH